MNLSMAIMVSQSCLNPDRLHDCMDMVGLWHQTSIKLCLMTVKPKVGHVAIWGNILFRAPSSLTGMYLREHYFVFVYLIHDSPVSI